MEEDIKILEGIIKGNEDCIETITKSNLNSRKDEDIEHYKKEINSIKNIINSYKREKARADKLEKDYSKTLTKIDKLEADLYSANSIINEQIDIINNSVSKDKVKELKNFIISDCKQKNIDLIPVSNLIKNINILLKGDE